MSKLLAPAFAAALLLAGCGEPEIDVTVPLALVNAAPHDGAANLDPVTTPTLCFNRAMKAEKAAGFLVLEQDGVGEVPGQALQASADGNCLTILHLEPLARGAAFTVRARKGLAAADGAALAIDLTSRFRTAAP